MLKPKFRFNRITDIGKDFFKDNGIDNIILDIDNTLTHHSSQEIGREVLLWLEDRKKENMGIVLLSNNSEERVRPFANRLGLEFVPKAKKPLRKGYDEVIDRFLWDRNRTVSIGDQLFTDILGANVAGIRSVLVEPFHKEDGRFFAFKRMMEELILGGKRNYD
jgi:HAD superfamily phosphatase (TIGR01668 family)